MTHTLKGLRWVLFGAYVLLGALALMAATPMGLTALGMGGGNVSFLPAMILGLPWSLPLYILDDGAVAKLAALGICYGLNVGVGLMLARGGD